jgi:Xaa-Pro aminopeptidase
MAAMREVHADADAAVLCDPQDIHYLTGVRDGISWLMVLDQETLAVSRHMLVREVRAELPDCEVLLAAERSIESPDLAKFVASQLARRGLERIVVDPAKLTAQAYLGFLNSAHQAALQVLGVPNLLANLRAVKEPFEIALTRLCVAIAETAFRDLLDGGSLVGRTERELARELELRMWDAGADRQGFPGTGIIVASGPNSACPHHSPGARRVARAEPVLFDWGAEVAGYRSDTTRTVFPGGVPDFAKRAYPVVEEALDRAAARLRAGAPMAEIDLAARETILAAGYPEFHYGVGHGVGLAIHEAPWLRADSNAICQPNMLTTIEPGVYLPDVGGIRIENVYRITADGSETMGDLPTALEAMVVH